MAVDTDRERAAAELEASIISDTQAAMAKTERVPYDPTKPITATADNWKGFVWTTTFTGTIERRVDGSEDS